MKKLNEAKWKTDVSLHVAALTVSMLANRDKGRISLKKEQVTVNLLTDFCFHTLTACCGFDVVQQLNTELVDFVKQLFYLGSHHVLKLIKHHIAHWWFSLNLAGFCAADGLMRENHRCTTSNCCRLEKLTYFYVLINKYYHSYYFFSYFFL